MFILAKLQIGSKKIHHTCTSYLAHARASSDDDHSPTKAGPPPTHTHTHTHCRRVFLVVVVFLDSHSPTPGGRRTLIWANRWACWPAALDGYWLPPAPPFTCRCRQRRRRGTIAAAAGPGSGYKMGGDGGAKIRLRS
jgi:hypothetical protein